MTWHNEGFYTDERPPKPHRKRRIRELEHELAATRTALARVQERAAAQDDVQRDRLDRLAAAGFLWIGTREHNDRARALEHGALLLHEQAEATWNAAAGRLPELHVDAYLAPLELEALQRWQRR